MFFRPSKINKTALMRHYKRLLGELDPKYPYILHVKLKTAGFRGVLHPYAWLIQLGARLNKEYAINHTALLYAVYEDKALGRQAKYVEAGLSGLRARSLWYLLDTVHQKGGELWLERAEGLKMKPAERVWLESFVDENVLDVKYNILKAIGSQNFSSALLKPLEALLGVIGKIGGKKGGMFCTEAVKTILDFLATQKEPAPKALSNLKKAHHLHPSEFFGKLGTPERIYPFSENHGG